MTIIPASGSLPLAHNAQLVIMWPVSDQRLPLSVINMSYYKPTPYLTLFTFIETVHLSF